MNKKANTTFIFVIVLISIIGFFIIFSNFFVNKSIISSEASDLACKTLISVKDSKLGKLTNFFYEINYQCRKDYIESKAKIKNKIFKEIADESNRCYKRYGSGKQDFLSNYDTQGNWCFECGEINFKNSDKNYKYNDFINYLNNNVDIKSKKKYNELFNIKSSIASSDDLFNIRIKLNEILNNGNQLEKETAMILGEQYTYVQNLRSKQINTNLPLYIVYKFDRIDSSFDQRLSTATKSVAIGTVSAIIIGAIGENILWWGASALSCGAAGLSLGLLSPLCGGVLATTIAKTGSKVVKGSVEVTKGFSKMKEILSVSNKLSKSIKLSLKTKKFRDINDFEVLGSDIKSMSKLSKLLKSKKNLELANRVESVSLKMKSLGINSIDEIGPEILKNKNKLKNLQNMVDEAINSKLITNPGITKAVKIESSYSKKIKDFKNLESEIVDLKGSIKEVDLPKIKDYLKNFFYLSGAVGGVIVANNLNFNSNQYISIMDQEEYYRKCGTQRFSKK